jgi:hypothetical protein
MILSSDEQRSLDVIGSDLCADEPRLAAKFGIFTRLAAGEDRPPDEDLVRPVRPSPPPAPVVVRAIPAAVAFRRSRGRHRGLLPRRNRMDFFVLGALLLLVILIFYVSRGR